MKDFFLALVVIVFLFIVFGEKDTLYNLGSTFRQGINDVSDGYNGRPKRGEER